ncbi:hypothetical protein [Caldimonas brevitalea]|uniref:Lipid A palmitoyltransferase PagP n=1 Tax=Caldimonas brevitalea TaxID=413882 RepID=A0A0G3BRX7_9BURK|nr:hypothetical protein [Caldimonas brevitalea]AKJ32177.1 hypothetical protein AAW51_5486 [Caldimonas brevitalea]
MARSHLYTRCCVAALLALGAASAAHAACDATPAGEGAVPCEARRAEADDAHKWWITSGFLSYHTRHASRYRRANNGLGVEWHLPRHWQLNAGRYRNSLDHGSSYLQAGWTPLGVSLGERLQLRVGASVGVVNGYPKVKDGGFFPTLVPVVSLEGSRLGANLVYIPSVDKRVDGAFALQLKVRVN